MASAKAEDKRRRIVEAATSLFNRYGFKRTSVDLLAAEAGVAKPTVYAYFDDKEEIFRAVVEHVAAELLAAAEEASRARAPIAERLAAMLSAKFTRYWELVHASPHAQELIDSQGRLGAEIVQRSDRAYLKLLVSVIEGSDELDPRTVGLSPQAAATLLLRAASGAAYDATSTASHAKHLAEIVRVVVSGMTSRR
ncbi:MAG: TetR/AcrR family transcriptional regulator [Deltaproteobacteria bacterium]|nr:TetR/AcrR family transcriptional regulator [Deltaproteobacteria bacterium]